MKGSVQQDTPHRRSRRCPKTWPHPAHGPWFTGEIVPAGSVAGYDCPGVEMPR